MKTKLIKLLAYLSLGLLLTAATFLFAPADDNSVTKHASWAILFVLYVFAVWAFHSLFVQIARCVKFVRTGKFD